MKLLSIFFVALALLAVLGGASAKIRKIHAPKVAAPAAEAPVAHLMHADAVEEKEIADEALVRECEADLKDGLKEEAALEQQKDQCLEDLAPFLDEDLIYEMWRDQNRTLALECLLNVTECNDDNEARYDDGAKRRRSAPRREVDASLVDHPYFAEEVKARKDIRAFDKDVFEGMRNSASDPATKQRRETIQCTYDRCVLLRTQGNWTRQQLRANITWCRAEIMHRKWSIMAYLRFSKLYQQETQVCRPICEQCLAGKRLLQVTVTNGQVGSVPRVYDLEPGLFGFLNDSSGLSGILTQAQTFGVFQFLSTGNVQGVIDLVDSIFPSAFIGMLGNGSLTTGGTWDEMAVVLPEDHSYLTVTIPTDSAGVFILKVPGVRVFNENGDFVIADETSVLLSSGSDKKKKKTGKKNKRNPIRDEIRSCGCVGDPLPHYERHYSSYPISTEVTIDYITPAYDRKDWVDGGFATLTVEELRWTVPYPPGIRPEVADLPSEYPNANTL